MRWTTRERPKIDRLACPWLIRKFIDPGAEINDLEASIARALLQVTCSYTRQFFDKTLRGISAPLYETNQKLNYIDLVQRYQ